MKYYVNWKNLNLKSSCPELPCLAVFNFLGFYFQHPIIINQIIQSFLFNFTFFCRLDSIPYDPYTFFKKKIMFLCVLWPLSQCKNKLIKITDIVRITSLINFSEHSIWSRLHSNMAPWPSHYNVNKTKREILHIYILT